MRGARCFWRHARATKIKLVAESGGDEGQNSCGRAGWVHLIVFSVAYIVHGAEWRARAEGEADAAKKISVCACEGPCRC